MCAANELQDHQARDPASNRRDRTRTGTGALAQTRPRRPCGCSHPASSGGRIASQPSARAGSLTPAALGDGRMRAVHRLLAYFLAVSFSFSPACFRLADFFFAVPSAWEYGFPVTFPAAFLALPLAASAVFLALSRLLIRISLLLPSSPVVPYPAPADPGRLPRTGALKPSLRVPGG